MSSPIRKAYRQLTLKFSPTSHPPKTDFFTWRFLLPIAEECYRRSKSFPDIAGTFVRCELSLVMCLTTPTIVSGGVLTFTSKADNCLPAKRPQPELTIRNCT